ncbi:hypothetical protein [Paenibacillus sp. MBLB4367]|uniref:hypothetical protein n=1 Tax=Paenibacillus sp. MBLB4367 TaxID=3384767 RepID=UPI003907FF59
MEAALQLGVPQLVLERDYYMIDLPLLLHHHKRKEASERLLALQIQCAPHMEEDAFKQFVEELSADLKAEQEEENDFDAGAIAQLRQRVRG